jgi:probable 2-oxoglutarate dehydrogenase E1 component DHKTD1
MFEISSDFEGSPFDIQNPEKIRRLLFTSGKHYYTLNEEREKRNRDDIAIIRLEELCPFPADELRQEIKKYKNAKEFLWCQEEHRNQGAWSFINPRFENIVGVHV